MSPKTRDLKNGEHTFLPGRGLLLNVTDFSLITNYKNRTAIIIRILIIDNSDQPLTVCTMLG